MLWIPAFSFDYRDVLCVWLCADVSGRVSRLQIIRS